MKAKNEKKQKFAVPQKYKQALRLRKQRIDYRHLIAGALILGSLALTWFCYRFPLMRAGQAFRDLFLSLRYYFVYLVSNRRLPVTVTQLPSFDLSDFTPFSTEEISRKLSGMWQLIFKGEVFLSYLKTVLLFLRSFSVFLLCVVPVLLLLRPLVSSWLVKFKTGSVQRQSKSVKRFRKAFENPVRAAWTWLRAFYTFLSSKSYLAILLLIWCLNLNLVTILVEFLAFYFYFVMSFDFLSLFVQLVKLLIDAIVMFSGAPFLLWLSSALAVLDRWRRSIGFSLLNRFERKNREFVKSLPIVLFLTGTMGSKKTTALTAMAVSEQIRFRDKALELIMEQWSKYPNFPFYNLEQELMRAMERHHIYSLTTARKWVRKKQRRFCYSPDPSRIFAYDIDQYALDHDDGLTVSSVFDMITDYACLFLIYTVQSSLIISNYSIRSDSTMDYSGHFPIWNQELFKIRPREALHISGFSHILDFDLLRLGKKMIKDNPLAGSFEFGVVVITEIGKERGNTVTLQEVKKNVDEANPKNDLFNNDLKMVRHRATVCGFPFIRVLVDDQRPESWGADARDLSVILHILESTDFKSVMPLFFIEELLHDLLYPKFQRWQLKYRENRPDITLFYYAVNNIMTAFHRYYTNIHNVYGESLLTFEVEAGRMDGVKNTHQYYLSKKVAHSDRFATDCFLSYFEELALATMYGLDDYPTYETVRASREELSMQHSYFIAEMERYSVVLRNEGEKELRKAFT